MKHAKWVPILLLLLVAATTPAVARSPKPPAALSLRASTTETPFVFRLRGYPKALVGHTNVGRYRVPTLNSGGIPSACKFAPCFRKEQVEGEDCWKQWVQRDYYTNGGQYGYGIYLEVWWCTKDRKITRIMWMDCIDFDGYFYRERSCRDTMSGGPGGGPETPVRDQFAFRWNYPCPPYCGWHRDARVTIDAKVTVNPSFEGTIYESNEIRCC